MTSNIVPIAERIKLLEAQVVLLREALLKVEYVNEDNDLSMCPWCYACDWGFPKHEPDCLRQRALKDLS